MGSVTYSIADPTMTITMPCIEQDYCVSHSYRIWTIFPVLVNRPGKYPIYLADEIELKSYGIVRTGCQFTIQSADEDLGGYSFELGMRDESNSDGNWWAESKVKVNFYLPACTVTQAQIDASLT